jgi:acrylyl-CoA reductase (NADPH)
MNAGINAIVAEKNAADEFTVGLKILQESDLPNESVLVEIDYSTFNYKDGLACTNASPICQKFPMVCGIDLAGTVIKSHDVRFNPAFPEKCNEEMDINF